MKQSSGKTKQPKKRTTLYLTELSDLWLAGEAKEQGISKNDIIQILVNKEMEAKAKEAEAVSK